MKVNITMKVIDKAKKTGSKGDYLKIVGVQEGEIIQAFTKTLDIATVEGREQTFACKIGSYKGQLQGIEILKVIS